MNRDGNTLFTYKVASMNDDMSYKALTFFPPPNKCIYRNTN